MGNADATNLINGNYKDGISIVECVLLSRLNVRFIKFDVSMLFYGLWKYFPNFRFLSNSYETNSPEGITAHLCELVDYFWKEYGIHFIPILDGERSEDKTRSPGKQMTGNDKRISQLLNAARVYHVASTAEADHALPAPFIDTAIRTHFGLHEDTPGAIFTKDSDIFSNGAFDPSRVIITSYDHSTGEVTMYTQEAFRTAFCKRYEIPPATAPQTAFLIMKSCLAASSREYVGHVRLLGFSRRACVDHLKEILPSLPPGLEQQIGLILSKSQDWLAAEYTKLKAKQLQLLAIKRNDTALVHGDEDAIRQGFLASFYHNHAAFVGMKDGAGNVIEPRPVDGEDASKLAALPWYLRKALLDPDAPSGDGLPARPYHTVKENQKHLKWTLIEKSKLILLALCDEARDVLNTTILERISNAAEVVTTHFAVTSPTAQPRRAHRFLSSWQPNLP